MKIVGVTACPTGIAHTYMAAMRLTNAARALAHEIKIETQGAMGIEHVLTAKEIRAADVVIIAADIPIVGEERFANCPALRLTTKEAIDDPAGALERALQCVAG
jgi:PTS system fructose-specific IIB component/fructose-specific PTS system IIB-like component